HTSLIHRFPTRRSSDLALLEMVETMDKDAQREFVTDKRVSIYTYFGWRHAFRCFMATDDILYLYQEFSRDSTPLMVRGLLTESLDRKSTRLNSSHEWIS